LKLPSTRTGRRDRSASGANLGNRAAISLAGTGLQGKGRVLRVEIAVVRMASGVRTAADRIVGAKAEGPVAGVPSNP
jgi:hypothetical protein